MNTDKTHDAGSPLYLKSVHVENVRCFGSLKFDLQTPDAKPRTWAVILGDNGVGKTTLLRSIAMGLCDEASAAGLLREIYGEWNREPGTTDTEIVQDAKVHLEFFPTEDADEISVTTEVKPSPLGYSRVKQRAKFGKMKNRDFPWQRIFACGYGAARRGFGTKDVDDYATLDAVYTLFNYDVPLQNPELVLRRVEQVKGDAKPVLDMIADVLQLEPDSIALTTKGLTIRGDWGTFHAIRGLGDGFQATLAWLTDFIGWAIFYDQDSDISDLAGIVLVDELEQHLHPRWQQRIVGLLSRRFPKVQFIATTHTPMCAIGMTDLPDGQGELILLRREGNSIDVVQDLAPPKGQRADQVLTSILFGLSSTTSDDLTQAVARYAQLKSKGANVSRAEEAEVARLFQELHAKLTSGETPLETAVKSHVSEALKRTREELWDADAVGFEVIRQLRKLASHDTD